MRAHHNFRGDGGADNLARAAQRARLAKLDRQVQSDSEWSDSNSGVKSLGCCDEAAVTVPLAGVLPTGPIDLEALPSSGGRTLACRLPTVSSPSKPTAGLPSARLCARLSAAQQSIAGADVWCSGGKLTPPPLTSEDERDEADDGGGSCDGQQEDGDAAEPSVAGELDGGLVSHAVDRAPSLAMAPELFAGDPSAVRSAEESALFGVVCPPLTVGVSPWNVAPLPQV